MPGHTSTSTAKANIHGKKLMLWMWWNQRGVINYELLQPNETSTGERYQREFMQVNRALNLKRPQGHEEVIRCSTPPAVFPRHCFLRISHAPVDDSLPGPEKQLTTHEEVKNWIDSWIASIDEERLVFFAHIAESNVETIRTSDNKTNFPTSSFLLPFFFPVLFALYVGLTRCRVPW